MLTVALNAERPYPGPFRAVVMMYTWIELAKSLENTSVDSQDVESLRTKLSEINASLIVGSRANDQEALKWPSSVRRPALRRGNGTGVYTFMRSRYEKCKAREFLAM